MPRISQYPPLGMTLRRRTISFGGRTALHGSIHDPDNLRNKTGLMLRAAKVIRIMHGREMVTPFPLSNRATDVRPGCKTQKIALMLRQVADLVCTRTEEREYFKTCELLSPVWAYAYPLN
ncbi:hypothetical protein PoB_005471300 [Plakobranchus ocellatus]|uniref:Uncharacterized protein n=1 Tax=Plakobranchus ocellatus TaxID=259542 RepID=A0AAV4C8K6_9GAST|nr:hypothetical protein PoB_005471300 [Plakobranchus ocellatus]